MPGGRLRVLLALPDLQDLGVQHDVRCLLKHWNHDEFDVRMLIHRREGAFASQFTQDMASIEVDRYVPDIPKARVVVRIAGYARAFRDFRPQAVISFVPYSNLACMWARPLSRHRFGLAVSEHAHVSASLRDREAFQGAFLWFYRRRFAALYNSRADVVKCIAEESRRDLVEVHGIRADKTRLIHNPVDFEEVRRLAAEPVDEEWLADTSPHRTPVLVNVGRLCHQKRQDLLLEAFALLVKRLPARLVLVGRGAYLERLQAQGQRLGVAGDVRFVGFQSNPWKYMVRANALAMSSDWEGLPCVITEAMCLGVPVVSTRCPSGPTEMLLDGEAGLLCPTGNAAALARALEAALLDTAATRRRVAKATDNLHRFSPEIVTRQYECLTRELAKDDGTA